MDSLNGAPRRKSSYSGSDCVEAGIAEAGRILVRNTADRNSALLSIAANAWARFDSSLK
jgi:hypothetical protein